MWTLKALLGPFLNNLAPACALSVLSHMPICTGNWTHFTLGRGTLINIFITLVLPLSPSKRIGESKQGSVQVS